MRVHPEAAREARAARRWYTTRNHDTGDRFLAEYKRALKAIADGPMRWAAHLGGRRYHMHRFPYSVIYWTAPHDVIEVLAVAHDARKPGYWQHRQ